jgi:hypothetical protein
MEGTCQGGRIAKKMQMQMQNNLYKIEDFLINVIY